MKCLDITTSLAYGMAYAREVKEHDNFISIRGKKTAVQSG